MRVRAGLWVCIAPALILATGCGGAAKDFERAVDAQGSEYETFRNALLRYPADELAAVLAAVLDQEDASWDRKLTAATLASWTADPGLHNSLLAAERTLDAAGQLHYAWARRWDPRVLQAQGVMYELVLKETREEDGAGDGIRTLIGIANRGGEVRTDLFLEGLGPETALEVRRRRRVAVILSSAAIGGELNASARQARSALRAELSVGRRDRPVARHLLDVVVRLGRKQEPATRDEIARVLHGDDTLRDLVGEDYRMQRLARLGGPEASKLVGQYLRDARPGPDGSLCVHWWGVEFAPGLVFTTPLAEFLRNVIWGRDPAVRPDVDLRKEAIAAYAAIARALEAADAREELEIAAQVYWKIPEDAVREERLRADFLALRAWLEEYR